MKSKLLVVIAATSLALATACSNPSNLAGSHASGVAHVPVTSITNVPTSAVVGMPLTLTGIVQPANATNRAIAWSVQNAGTTGANITDGNILSATYAGTVTVRATIINGAAQETNFTRDFAVIVSYETTVPGTNLAEQLAWLRANASSGNTYFVEIRGNETIAPAGAGQALPTGRSNLTIILRGVGEMRYVSLSANGSHFWIPSGITVVLDEYVTLQGHSSNDNHLVWISSGGTLVMNEGSRIAGNQNTAFAVADGGGGVRVNNGGVFILDGGEISGNSTTDTGIGGGDPGHGGGVRVDSGGRFDMLCGTISGNAGQFGGGVFIANGGTFRMGGGVIYGNEATVDLALRNTARSGGASLSNMGTAQRGAFNADGGFILLGTLTSTNNTIRITTPLTGTVSITGAAMVGRALTANTAGLGGSGGISFQWIRRNGDAGDWIDISGATSGTFFARASDLGWEIAVRVTRANNSGSITSLPTAAVTEREEVFSIDFGIGIDQIAGPEVSLAAGPETVTVSNSEQFSQIRWFRGATELSGSGSRNETITLDQSVHNDRIGVHRVTVEVIRGGVRHSMAIVFTVVP